MYELLLWKEFREKYPGIEKQIFEAILKNFIESQGGISDKFSLSQKTAELFKVTFLNFSEEDLKKYFGMLIKKNNDEVTIRHGIGGPEKKDRQGQWKFF